LPTATIPSFRLVKTEVGPMFTWHFAFDHNHTNL
jgi:hypothetical protein